MPADALLVPVLLYELIVFKKLRILNSLGEPAIALLDNAIRYTKSLGFEVAKPVLGLAEVSSIFKKALDVLRCYSSADSAACRLFVLSKSQQWKVLPVGEGLWVHASDPLEDLTLSHDGPYQKSDAVTHYLGSLQWFPKLKFAKIMIAAIASHGESSSTATFPGRLCFRLDTQPTSHESSS
ncbi:MAG: hypothetical protein LQ345_002616 [Seirophora villosa]|nr:MAG: hypothetical protein LQ345_002616 [Seirophora villosa]